MQYTLQQVSTASYYWLELCPTQDPYRLACTAVCAVLQPLSKDELFLENTFDLLQAWVTVCLQVSVSYPPKKGLNPTNGGSETSL